MDKQFNYDDYKIPDGKIIVTIEGVNANVVESVNISFRDNLVMKEDRFSRYDDDGQSYISTTTYRMEDDGK